MRTRRFFRLVPARLSRQMIGQRAARGFRCRRSRRGGDGSRCWCVGLWLAALRFQFLQPQLQLLDLPLQLLRLPPKLHALQLGQQQLQMLDLALPREQFVSMVACQDQALATHPREERSDREAPPLTCAEYRMNARVFIPVRAKKVVQRISQVTPTAADSHVRSGRRQSMPSSSIDNCARVNETVPLAACGHTKRPRSSRFANRHNPSPSYHRTLIRSPLRPRNTNTCPENGFCSSLLSHQRAQPGEAAPQVRHSRCNPNSRVRRRPDHPRRHSNNTRTNAGSALPSMRTCACRSSM